MPDGDLLLNRDSLLATGLRDEYVVLILLGEGLGEVPEAAAAAFLSLSGLLMGCGDSPISLRCLFTLSRLALVRASSRDTSSDDIFAWLDLTVDIPWI